MEAECFLGSYESLR